VTAAARPRPDPVTAWKLAVRLPTLTASVTPVIVGTGAAIRDDVFDALPAFAALFAALCLQVAANLANDVFDFKRGADTAAPRLGPPRASSSGWLTTRQLFAAMWTAVGLAFLAGIYLAVVGGWPIVVIGLASIVTAIAYTGGPFPLAYHGLGDAAAFFFFGLVAVGGTYYVQAEEIRGLALLAGVPVGCTVTAILVVNNLRDIAGDRVAKKWTLAVVMGDRLTRAWYTALLVAAYAVAAGTVLAGDRPGLAALLLLSLPWAYGPLRAVLSGTVGPALNPVLRATARLNLVLGLCFAAALALG
jgi:1,4-dihydroxy-2-naphthoate octaprenyltransferase